MSHEMLRDDAVSIIQEQLGYRSDLSASIVTTMQLAQNQLELGPTLPWFLLSERSYILTTVGDQRVPVPLLFLQEYEESALIYVKDSETEYILGKKDLDWLFKKFPAGAADEETQEPQYYALRGDYFIIFPVPDAQYALWMTYYKKAQELDSNIENEWLKNAPYLLIGKTGAMLPSSLKTDKMQAQFQAWESEGRATLYGREESRTHVGRDDYAMGGSE